MARFENGTKFHIENRNVNMTNIDHLHEEANMLTTKWFLTACESQVSTYFQLYHPDIQDVIRSEDCSEKLH